MKFLIFILFLSINSSSCIEIDNVRSKFHEINDKEKLLSFLTKFENINCKEAEPYLASATMTKSRYAFITKKMNYFNTGKDKLEQYIVDNPNNIESKYVRLLVQKEIPLFLNYSKNITQDSIFIETNISSSSLPKAYQKLILENIRK